MTVILERKEYFFPHSFGNSGLFSSIGESFYITPFPSGVLINYNTRPFNCDARDLTSVLWWLFGLLFTYFQKIKELLLFFENYRPVQEAVSYRGSFTAGWFGVREKHCFRLKIYDRLRSDEHVVCNRTNNPATSRPVVVSTFEGTSVNQIGSARANY